MSATTDAQRDIVLVQTRLKIAGAWASKELEADIVSITVDERLHVPAMAEIRLNIDPITWSWLDKPDLREGKEIEVHVGPTAKELPIFNGIVGAIEADLSERMPSMTVRAYDRSFRLHRGAQTRSFLKQSDSDIAQKIAREAGLTAKADSTNEVYDFVLQHNQTNWAFLHARAERLGFELRADGQNLLFRKPTAAASGVTLEWGVNMQRFRPHLTVAEQVDEVQVRGWDVKKKQAIVGTAATGANPSKSGEAKTGKANARSVWTGSAKRFVVDAPVSTQGDATKTAQGLLDDLTSAYIRVEGECFGDPNLLVGKTVTINKVGTRFAGDYYLTGVIHRLSAVGGHQVAFTASTRRPSALTKLVQGTFAGNGHHNGHAQSQGGTAVPGVMVGVVTNNNDAEGQLARVKVKFPWMAQNAGTDIESEWARLVPPMAGPDRGMLITPEVNDEVLVAFEHGDPARPFVLGALWNGKDKPAKGTAEIVAGGKVNQRVWRSRTGHVFIFDDKDGEEGIYIIDKTSKNHIKITSKDNKLDVHLEGDIQIVSKGSISVTAEKDITMQAKTGEMSLKAKKGIRVESETDTIVLKAAKDVQAEAGLAGKFKTGTAFNVEAGTSAGIKATTDAMMMGLNTTVKANVAAKMQGMNTEIKGQVMAKVEAVTTEISGTAMAKLGGAMVNIQGTGPVVVTGLPIKLN